MAIATGAIVGGAIAAGGAVSAAVIGGNAMSGAADKQAASQQALGQEQLDLAKQEMANQKAARAEAVASAAELSKRSYGEMASIQSMLQTKQQGLQTALGELAKTSSILDATDPTIKAAGQNLVDMLNGKAAAALAPIRAEQARQRANLESNLSSKLGPGWRTSSAGIEAASRFDALSLQTMSQVQLQTMQTVAGVMGTAGQIRPNNLAAQASDIFKTAQGADASILGAEQNITNRQTNAYLTAETGNQVNFGAATGALGQQIASPPLVGAGGMISGGVAGSMFNDLGKIGANVSQSIFAPVSPLSSGQQGLVDTIKNMPAAPIGVTFGSSVGGF